MNQRFNDTTISCSKVIDTSFFLFLSIPKKSFSSEEMKKGNEAENDQHVDAISERMSWRASSSSSSLSLLLKVEND